MNSLTTIPNAASLSNSPCSVSVPAWVFALFGPGIPSSLADLQTIAVAFNGRSDGNQMWHEQLSRGATVIVLRGIL